MDEYSSHVVTFVSHRSTDDLWPPTATHAWEILATRGQTLSIKAQSPVEDLIYADQGSDTKSQRSNF